MTGALEAGALLGATVRFQGPIPNSPTAIIDTESRHLLSDAAAQAIRNIATECRQADFIYKKTDSTLRGNIVAEMEALSEILGGARTSYVPAYPAMGRVVRHGRLYVHGVSLEATQFARDPLNPITDGAVPEGTGVEVFNGETNEHVANSVRLALHDSRVRIIAGPASVAAELAHQLDLQPAPMIRLPKIGTCLVVNGSLHDMSAQQIRNAHDAGLLTKGWRESPSRTGRDVAALLAADTPDALIVFGGDTAFDLIDAIGRPILYPLGEVVTGVPVTRIEGRRTILITKAGGFGSPDLLMTIKKTLNDR